MVVCFRLLAWFALVVGLRIGVVSCARVSGFRCGLGGFLVGLVDCLCCLRVDSVVIVVGLRFCLTLSWIWLGFICDLSLRCRLVL